MQDHRVKIRGVIREIKRDKQRSGEIDGDTVKLRLIKTLYDRYPICVHDRIVAARCGDGTSRVFCFREFSHNATFGSFNDDFFVYQGNIYISSSDELQVNLCFLPFTRPLGENSMSPKSKTGLQTLRIVSTTV